MNVESKVSVIASAGVAALTAAGTGSAAATLRVWRRNVSGSWPASTGNTCPSRAAAVRYVIKAENWACSRSSSGVERTYGGHVTPASVVPQPAQRKRGRRTVTWPNSVATACWR
jgi:hypothetical protein